MKFTTNIGRLDRMLRIIGGAVLISLTLTHYIGLWGWLGLILIATALINWCPMWVILGVNTSKK